MYRNKYIQILKNSFDKHINKLSPFMVNYFEGLNKEELEFYDVDEEELKKIVFDLLLCKLNLQEFSTRLTSTFISRGFVNDNVTKLNKESIKEIWENIMVYYGESDPYSNFIDHLLDDLKDKYPEDVFEAMEISLTN